MVLKCEKMGIFMHCWGEYKINATFLEGSMEVFKIIILFNSAIPSLGIYLKETCQKNPQNDLIVFSGSHL
jgi:hypothetical protein